VNDVYKWNLLFGGLSLNSSTHGSPGWSAVGLLRSQDEIILLDTGGQQYRARLAERLAEYDIGPSDITAIALTHCHWDHMSNFPMFENAHIYVSAVDLAWASGLARGDLYVPELYVEELVERERVTTISHGFEISPRLRALASAGHTPGHMSFMAETDDGPVLFAGDAIKDERELTAGAAAMTLDAAASSRSIRELAELCEQEAAVLVCGHDRPLRVRGGKAIPSTIVPEVLNAAPGTLRLSDAWA
jgi:N-acyl homoserine lactone hydrolase